jgi:tetratricopeptide (TPR) repeat protein
MAKRHVTSLNGLFTIVVLLVTILAFAIILGGCSPPTPSSPTPSSQQVEYVGHVLDINTGNPIEQAEVTFDYQGAPPIVYSDSHGIYRFTITIQGNPSKVAGRVRVRVEGYENEDRNITLYVNNPNIEDIRLNPASTPGPTKMRPLGPFSVRFAVAIASFGEIDENGHMRNSSKGYDLSTQVFEMLQSEFESLPPDLKDKSLLWHDSLPLAEKDIELGTISGDTPQERRTAAEKLAKDIEADVIIYGHFAHHENTSAFVPEFYVSPINGQAEEIVGHTQLGSAVPIPSNCEQDPKCALILIPELSVRTKALTRFTVGLMYDLIGSNQEALETFERMEQELTDWDETNEGKEVLYYFIGYEALALSYDENNMKKSFPTIEDALESAETYFLNALDSNQGYVRAHIGLGNVYYRRAGLHPPQQRLALLDQAKDHYEQALANTSELPGIPIKLMARYGLAIVSHSKGVTYLELGSKDEANTYLGWAIEELEALLEPLSEASQQRKLTQAYFALGAAYHGQAEIKRIEDDPESSIALFRQAEEAYTKCVDTASITFNKLVETAIGPDCERYAQEVETARLVLEKQQ